MAGLCRSLFAKRSCEQIGETPIGYLTRWRMLLATDRMTTSRESLAQLASSLGYNSKNSFNTAFKRVMGCSPRRYARDTISSESINATSLGNLIQRTRPKP